MAITAEIESRKQRMDAQVATSDLDKPIVIVSSDTHIGPRLSDMRPYCPQRLLAQYDEFVKQHTVYRQAMEEVARAMFNEDGGSKRYRAVRNSGIEGHHDPEARLRDLDSDGVAGEIVFHASQNDEPLPFTNLGDPRDMFLFKAIPPTDPELAAEGMRIYNRWLSDACSVQPERHAGLAHLPIWDVEQAVAEIKWARENGLRGINFPAPQRWLPAYNKPVWEPLWTAAEEFRMPLDTHIGAASDADFSGVDGRMIGFLEQSLMGPRAVPWLLLSGVFERHPELKLVITEIPGLWWPRAAKDLDSAYRYGKNPPQGESYQKVFDMVPHMPSEYCERNIIIGASFMSKGEAEDAYSSAYYSNCMWGSDYPHAEGTFQAFTDGEEKVPVTQLSLRSTFSGIPEGPMRLMMGTNAVDVFGMDLEALQKVANRIEAPTPRDIAKPYDGPPEGVSTLGFRRNGVWD
jgi:predicted TIM-barrel fold metal-dependent hydrolase